MISERQLAKGFRELWDEILPVLTPHFMRLFNEAYRSEISGDISPVQSGRDTDPAMVAEFAFHLARLVHERAGSFEDVSPNDPLIMRAESIALSLIAQYETIKYVPPTPLTQDARSEGLLLVRNYGTFLAKHSTEEIKFSPNIPGSGFIDSCMADLSIGKTLFEVKTVERNIASKDLRQLLVYLALQSATGEKRWSQGGFFNPRRGLVYEFSIDKIIPLISGGRLASEVFQDMVQFFGTRDIQIDSAF
jgi:hypothetical protein